LQKFDSIRTLLGGVKISAGTVTSTILEYNYAKLATDNLSLDGGQGVLLEGSAATYDLTVADADATNYEGNLLQATATDVALQSDGSECIDIRMTHTLLTGSNPRMYNEEVSDGDGFVIG